MLIVFLFLGENCILISKLSPYKKYYEKNLFINLSISCIRMWISCSKMNSFKGLSFSEQVIAKESNSFLSYWISRKKESTFSSINAVCDVSYHYWVKRQEITDPDKMMGCWEFYQILLFILVMAVILVQCHYAHQLYILNWVLNLYFYHSIIIEKDKWLKHFLQFYNLVPHRLSEHLS